MPAALDDFTGPLGIIVAALGGAAVGVERQRSGHASGPRARFGGVRTFTLIGGIAGLAGWFTTLNLGGVAIVLTAGAVALVVAGYVAASRREIDATTEAAALVVIGAGLAAGVGWRALASGIIAISTLLLIEKSRLHALAGRIDDEELRAAARFGVMAIVVLPLLPEGPIGPLGGIRPRELWLLVLFFTGLSFAGYLARRIVGAGHGYPLAGLLGGLISSTNVTFTFARLSRQEGTLAQPLAMGAIAACTMLFPRVHGAESGGPRVLSSPWPSGAGGVWRPPFPASEQSAAAVGPFVFGDSGLLVSGAVLGLTDVDALTISMTTTPIPRSAPAVAAEAIAIGILSNCVLKLVVAVGLGTPRFGRVTGAVLAAMAAAIVVAIVVMSMWP